MSDFPLVTVIGAFRWSDGRPVEGSVEFMPEEMALNMDGVLVATRSYEVPLQGGTFKLNVLATNRYVSQAWHYFVKTPVEIYKVALPYRDMPYRLEELIAS